MNSMINNLSAIKEFSTIIDQPSKITNNNNLNLTKSIVNEQSFNSNNNLQV